MRLAAEDLACIRDDRILFEHLNFSLQPGQLLLVEGENGSGKTSLLRIISGIRVPDEGSVIYSKEDNAVSIHHTHGAYSGDMAFLGHLDGIKLELTVQENLRTSRALSINSTVSIEQALATISLSRSADLPASSLSAGQRRRLALARLIVTEAPVWILDEPFTALDQQGIRLIEQLIHSHLENNGIVIMTSHHQVSLPESIIIRIRLGS